MYAVCALAVTRECSCLAVEPDPGHKALYLLPRHGNVESGYEDLRVSAASHVHACLRSRESPCVGGRLHAWVKAGQ